MKERLRELIAEALELPADEIPDDASSQTVEEWDSLAHIDILQVVEQEAGIRFTIDEIPELTTLDRIMQAIEKHGGSL